MDELPPLERFRAFEAAARLGSFKRASNELSLTSTAISHRIRNLEDDVGVQLFIRTGKGVSLTPEGKKLQKAATNAIGLLRQCVKDLENSGHGKPLKISSTPMFASRYLIPNLKSFEKEVSDAGLEVISTNDHANLIGSEVDATVRMGAPPKAPLWSEAIFPASVKLVRARASNLTTFDAQSDAIPDPYLCMTQFPKMWDYVAKKHSLRLIANGKRLWFDSLEAIIESARAGHGSALVPGWAIDGKERDLVLLSESDYATGMSYRLVVHRDKKERREIIRLRSWIRTLIS